MALHSQRATLALQKLATFDPAFASLSLWCEHRDTVTAEIDVDGKSVTVDFAHALAWTNGRTIHYSADYGALSLDEQVGVAAHEIMHVAFRHVSRGKKLYQRFGDKYDPFVFNVATDAIINQTLLLAGYTLPKGVVLVELLEEVFDEKVLPQDAVGKWDGEALYVRLMQEKPGCSAGGGAGSATAQGGDGDGQSKGDGQDESQNIGQSHGKDPKDAQGDGKSPRERLRDYAKKRGFADDMDSRGPQETTDSQEDSEWQQRHERALRHGREAGKGVGAMGHKIGDIPKSRTPWELILRRLVTKAVTRHPRQSYARPARRWIGAEDNARRRGAPTPAYEPGIVKMNGRPRIAVGVDVSGSIGNTELEIFAGEIAAIGKKTGAEIHLIVFDTQVLSVNKLDGVDFEAEIKKVEFARGGGTSFVDVMEKAIEIDPSIVVVLTDLYGPFGDTPNCKVVWASPDENPPEAPFGTTLSLAA